MHVVLSETGEIRELSLVDWQDRTDYAEAIISHSADASNFIFDSDSSSFATDTATFNRWANFCARYTDIDAACSALGLSSSLRTPYDALMHL